MEYKFSNALRNNDLEILKQIPKTDLHNHGGLGCRLSSLEKALGYQIESPPTSMAALTDMNKYINNILKPIYENINGFEFAIAAALFQAAEDNVTILEMSIDCIFTDMFEKKANGLISFLQDAHRKNAPEMDFRPEIGINRELPLKDIEKKVHTLLETNYFECIDLYGIEDANDPVAYKSIYKKAKNLGLKCKAHAGEFGSAESVRHAVQTLELDAVQHGINIIESKDVMNWIRNNEIQLNMCPTSNVVLKRVESIKKHPIRELFDHGIKVTVNTDDILIFDQSVSEEYLNLYNAGVFNEEELDIIIKNGLSNELNF